MICKTFFRIAILLPFFSASANSQTLQSKWENLPGPDGGNVLQFETDGNMLYALTRGGIYKSQNDGETWALLEGSRNVADRFAKFEADAGVLYVLNGDGILSRSRDMGATWKSVLQKPYPVDVPGGRPTGFFVMGDTVIALTVITIYRSVNQGDTWQQTVVPNDFSSHDFKSFAKVGNDVFVAYDRFILKSKDSGLTWEQNFSSSFNFADMEAIDTVLYALYDGYPRLIRSYDHGVHWDKIDADSIKFGQYNDETSDWLTGTGDKVFYASDYWCVHGGVQMFRSFDGGEDWGTCQRLGLRSHFLNDLKALPQRLLAGTEQGVFRSQDDATSFQPFHQGMNSTVVYSLSKTHTGRWWTNTGQGVFSSDNDGKTWDLRFPGELEDPCNSRWNQILFTKRRIVRTDPDLYYNTHAWTSDDGGDSWTEIPPTSMFWSPEVYASDETIWLAEKKQLYKMKDSDHALFEVTLPAQGYPSDILVSGNKIVLSIGQERYVSDNQGETWEIIDKQTPAGQQAGWPMYMDTEALFAVSLPFEDTMLVYNFREKIWKPFYPIAEGDTLKYWAYQILKTVGGLRWIAVNGRGLYYSSVEEPETWYPFGPLFPFKSPSALAFDVSEQEMWVGTAGAGIYKTKFRLQQDVPPAISFGVYPNPSVGESTLSSASFFAEKMVLRVFDVSGKLLREQSLPPGQSWDINLNLPNGLYVWQVITSQGSVSFKWLRMG